MPCLSQELLDLPTALQQALEHNRELARSGLSVRRGKLGIKSARSEFATRLRPDSAVGFTGEDESWRYGLSAVKKILPGTEVSMGGRYSRLQDDETADTRRVVIEVEVRQPLFRNFGSLVQGEAIVMAQSRLMKARRDYQRARADLVIQVVETYEKIIRLERQIKSDEAFFARMEKLYRLSKARQQQGHTTRVDTLRVELQRGQAQSRLENNREQLASTKQDLAELLGLTPETTFELVPPPMLDMDLPPLQEAVTIAMGNRLDYAQVLQDHEDGERGVRIARKNLYPAVNLVARYEKFGEEAHFSDAAGLDEDDWFVGLEADADLNVRKEQASLGEAKIEAKSAGQTIRIKELSLVREVQQAMSAYRRAQTNLKTEKRNFRLAESRAKLARRLFELGRGDNFTATDAEQAFLQAEVSMLTARAEASLSGYRLLRSLGTLIEYPEDLKPKVAEAEL